ncbi:reverse transcriptase domain-containing protein [Pedobacter sp. Hv1]|uniref:reverse transcriptase domain-containing protein n=1 Tax=Pedobacter sp. Hv1 TaxID=1740090 RepID=UPI0006D88C54|nr:reverse transcriptase domain-containing protein [Pedobacter sp. Hv1]KQC00946.1 hypothetical protein AQF98_09755 [Pedobacter sp. Hv1]
MLDKLASEEFLLQQAWQNINKGNPESFGISGENIDQYRKNLHTKIPALADRLKNGKYDFSPTRAYAIPKDNGKFRPLQIPEVEDRIVLKGIAILLEEHLQKELEQSKNVSFAYQKGIGVQKAIEAMQQYYSEGYKVVFEADIINFFPTVNKEQLLLDIFPHLPDTSINELIRSGISQPVGGLDKIKSEHHPLFTTGGIPQGNALSPLFSNFFLRSFDARMVSQGFKLIRYADDFIVMCKDENEALRAHKVSLEVLEDQLGLKLHALSSEAGAKTRIVAPAPGIDFSFLSVAFDGDKIFPSRKSVNRYIDTIRKLCNAPKVKDVYTLLLKLRNSLDGWVSTYSYTDLKRYFDEIDSEMDQGLLNGLERLNWVFSTKSKGRVKGKFRKKDKSGNLLGSGQCLSKLQRQNSGVPFCDDILKLRRPPIDPTISHV